MQTFDVFQKNNLKVGTHLAAEIPSTSPEIRIFVVIGTYIQTLNGNARPSNILNKDWDDLRFSLYKYGVNKSYLDTDDEISEKQLIDVVHLTSIQNIEQLERELSIYLQDFSLLKVAWKFDPLLPFL